METIIQSLLFIFFLAIVIKSADYFTEAAEKIGLHFKISPFIIGVTIIALGTSLPEVATSVSSVLKNESSMVINNVVGSNMANILFVLAITAIVGRGIKVDRDIIKNDLPILLASTILIFLTTLDGVFTIPDAIISLIILLTYTIYNAKSHRQIDPQEKRDQSKLKKETKKLGFKQPLIMITSGVALYFSASFTIDSVITIANIFNISTGIIAVSAVAIGTSLPELAVSIIAIKKGKADIAIGNITGSNIFNILGVMGIPALIGPLEIPQEVITFHIPALLLVTILYIFITIDKEISQWEGITLLMLFVAYLGKTFGLI
ncbi:calcium/sodium antiporter [Candidatus Gracilibacteria bacterium]|nr:calcium/sodium antiporter [Candidatus Gracilibacteria bacterium]